jgi:hypothetical protein
MIQWVRCVLGIVAHDLCARVKSREGGQVAQRLAKAVRSVGMTAKIARAA